MKNKLVFPVIGLALVFGIMAAGCGSSGNRDVPTITPELNYSSDTDDMVIVFKEAPAANIRAVTELELKDGLLFSIFFDGNEISNGYISVNLPTITFICGFDNNRTFTATVDGGSIEFDNGIIDNNDNNQTVTYVFTKEEDNGVNPFPGTWYDDDGGWVVVTQNTWAYSNPSPWVNPSNGTYTYIGKTATYLHSGSDTIYVTRLYGEQFHTEGRTFSKN
jgi:hypothetical protein